MTFTFATLLALAAAADPAALNRRILIAANNEGDAFDQPLQYAEADARAVASTLLELGMAHSGELDLLLRASRTKLLEAAAHLRAPQDAPVIVFLSSHGDARGAHLRGELLSWTELAQQIATLDAKVVITFVDACQSGALLTPKGFKRGPPLSVSVKPAGPAGRVIITSSGANEISNESILIQGSPFATALISALRGGADADADGRVTVEETYRYLYGRTVAATLRAPTGPQHPVWSVDLKGAGEIVLSTPAARHGVRLRRSPGARGACYILDAREVRVLAELPAEAGAALMLPAGEHVVKCLGEGELRAARVSWSPGQEVVLDHLSFRSEPPALALAKGPRGATHLKLTVGGALATDSTDDAHPALALRLRRGDGVLGWNLQLVTSPRDPFASGLWTIGGGYTLPWWGGPDARLEVGLNAGARTHGSLGERATAVIAGQYAEVDWLPSDDLTVTGRFDLQTAVVPDDRRTFVFFVFSLGVAHEL